MILNLRSTNHSDGMSSSRRIIDAVQVASKPAWMEAYVTGTEAVHADLTTASQDSIATGRRRLRAPRAGLPAGYAERVLDFTSIGAINWITPVLLFAVLFGLSKDYEVFLLSRIRELHDRGHGNVDAVALGLERTGGVITGAALVMIVVFAAFTLSPILVIKELGFALAAAVLIDATIIRMVLVPATMRLLGDWNWRIPGWLGRLLPRVELEREVAGAGATPMASALGPAMADGGAVPSATAGGARGEGVPTGSDDALAGGTAAVAQGRATEGPAGDSAKPARRPRLRLGIPAAAALAGGLSAGPPADSSGVGDGTDRGLSFE